jgi:hypothetical protein
LCYEWFVKVFIPEAKERNKSGKKVILIYDGHHSHTTYKLIQKAIEHDIILYCLPAHTTHRLQPLDVGIFGPLSKQLSKDIDGKLEDGERVTKVNFIEVYLNARNTAFLPDTIISAFRSSGICPLNPNVFTAADFAPSYSTSTEIQLPEGYPAKINYIDKPEDNDSEFHDGWEPLERPDGIADSDSDSSDEEPIVLGEDAAEITDEEYGVDDGIGSVSLLSVSPSLTLSSPSPENSQPPAFENDSSRAPAAASVASNGTEVSRDPLHSGSPSLTPSSSSPENSQPPAPMASNGTEANRDPTTSPNEPPIPTPVQVVRQRWKRPPGRIDAQLHAAESHIRKIEDELIRVTTHCSLMAHECLGLKRKLNTKQTKRKPDGFFNMDARCFTDEDAARQRQLEEERIRKDLEDKEKRKADREARKRQQKEKQPAARKRVRANAGNDGSTAVSQASASVPATGHDDQNTPAAPHNPSTSSKPRKPRKPNLPRPDINIQPLRDASINVITPADPSNVPQDEVISADPSHPPNTLNNRAAHQFRAASPALSIPIDPALLAPQPMHEMMHVFALETKSELIHRREEELDAAHALARFSGGI